MVCGVVVAMMFALPFIAARAVSDRLWSTGGCSMSWRSSAAVAAGRSVPVGALVGSTEPRFSIGVRIRSFGHAGRGAMRLLRYEHSAWIQLSIAAVAVVLAIALQISASDWRWIVVACGMVLSVEGLNTAVEATCDRISVAYSEQIKLAKDVAAGAVLLSSIAAAVIGVLTFWPYLFADNPVAGPMVWSSSQPFNPSAYHCIAGTDV